MNHNGEKLPVAATRPVLFPRPWGGDRLPELYAHWLDKADGTPGKPVGEAWLVADHPECESPLELPPSCFTDKITTLRDWMNRDANWLLGSHARPTPTGRFPLLLKLIHATDWLSVQVHPDDQTARELGEPDVGKTEMWTFLDVHPESSIIAGLRKDFSREEIAEKICRADRNIARCLLSHRPRPGDSVLIPAGTLHAIGPGLLLAEIQQNSNITYRVYDWDRKDERGNRRALHPEKSLAAIRWDLPAPTLTAGVKRLEGTQVIHCLGTSSFFHAERVEISETACFATGGTSFHILLNPSQVLNVRVMNHELAARPAQAVLVPAGAGNYWVTGPSTFLRYYVP
ncbi:MAG: class I mannose-6-phosphate isomerase [Candidatus Hydrogenedentes bacterium]|nr:class I mannose-6-phosphate isomerase [Candidatus Hydrogenedentota bacterium]